MSYDWLDKNGYAPQEHGVTDEVKERIADIIDRRIHNDDEPFTVDHVQKEIEEEYPEIDVFALETYLKEEVA